MPTVREIEQALFRLAPKEGAMDWDNVGQLLGDPEAEVRRVLVALDITEAVADEAIAENCQLIVSHHPVMNCKWLPVQTVRQDTPQGHLLLKILRSGLSAICMHTNLDVAPGGVNDALAAALGLFLGTRLGLSVRATGDNMDMVRASSINTNFTITVGLCLANAMTGLAGAMAAQYNTFADVNGGTGMVVLASVPLVGGTEPKKGSNFQRRMKRLSKDIRRRVGGTGRKA